MLTVVMKTVTPIPTMSYSGKASIREVNIMAKFVETQMKSPIFSGKPLQKKHNYGITIPQTFVSIWI